MALKFTKASKAKAKARVDLIGPSGSGKAQPADRNVMTPSGWRNIGSLRVGDEVVDPDGGIGRVEGVYPQGKKEAIGIKFSDGAYTECCREHLWLTQTPLDRAANRPGSVKTMDNILASMRRREGSDQIAHPNHYTPMVASVDIGGHDLPLDPWLVGVLIGDGSLTGGSISISKPGEEFRSAVADSLPDGVHVSDYGDDCITFRISRDADSGTNPVINILRDLGLMGKKSTEKVIPKPYMLSSFENRVALMQGLLDTDGYIERHTVEYSTSSPELAKQMRELVQSVGGTSSISSRIPHYTHLGEYREGAENFRLFISLPPSVLPVRLSAKLHRYTPRSKYKPYRSMVEASSVGIKECVCIKVSTRRNLYITDEYIVTHNTWHALEIATELVGPGGKIALIDTEHESASKYADRFAFDALNLESFSPRNYIEAIKAAADGEYDALIIDSLSHAWMGKDGALEMASAAEKRSGNKFASWRDVSPEVARLIESILHSPMHVIATMRSKTEYSLEKDERGKTVPKKIGMAAIFKGDVEYEFDVVGELNQDNEVVITKTRCAELNEKVFKRDGAGIGKILIKWLSDGVEPTNIPAPAPTVATVVANVTSTFGPGVTVEADPLAAYRDRIDAVTSVAELKAIAEDLRKLPVADQKLMGKSYSAKMIELNAAGG